MLNKILFWAFSLTLCAVPLFVYPAAGEFTLPKFVLLQLTALALCLLSLTELLGKGVRLRLPSGFRLAFWLWLLWTGVSCLYSRSRSLALDDLGCWAAFAAVYLLSGGLVRGGKRRHTLLTGVAAVGGLTAALGIVQYYFPSLDVIKGRQSLVTSTLGNPNYLASFAAVVLPIATALLVQSGRKGRQIFFGFCLFLCALALWITRSRTAAVLFFTAPAIQLWASHIFLDAGNARRFRRRAAAACALLLAAVVVFSLAPQAGVRSGGGVNETFTGPRKVVSFRQRMMTWKIALQMAADHPLQGVGTGNFKYWYPSQQGRFLATPKGGAYRAAATGRSADEAHNDYLQMLAETGVVGLGLFVWFVAGGMVSFVVRLVTFTDRPDFSEDSPAALERQGLALVFIGILCSALAGLIYAAFDFPLHLPASGALIWAALGLLARFDPDEMATGIHALNATGAAGADLPDARCPDGESAVWKPSPGICAAILTVAAAVSIYLGWRAVLPALAAREVRKANELAAIGGHPLKGLPPLRRAVKLDPGFGDAWSEKGRFHLILGRSGEAERDLLKALELKDNAAVHFNLGLALENQGKPREAFIQYEKASAIDPYYAPPHHRMGLMALDRRQADEAVREFELLARLYPDERQYWRNLAVGYGMAGRIDSAAPLFDKLLSKEPEACDLLVNAALAHDKAENRARAVEYVIRAEKLKCDRAAPTMEILNREPAAGSR